MFVIQLLVDMFRRPFAYLGMAMIVMAFMMGWNAVVSYYSLPIREREAELFFATGFYFLGFMVLAVQVMMEVEGRARQTLVGAIFAGNLLMAGWVWVGPFIGYPFLGLSLIKL